MKPGDACSGQAEAGDAALSGQPEAKDHTDLTGEKMPEGGFSLQLAVETLRSDLIEYHALAGRLGLPVGTEQPEALPDAEEAELVDTAANLGWDLGKYCV